MLAELVGFQKRGCDVWLLAPAESEIFRRATSQNIPVVPLCVDKLRYPLEALRLARWLRAHRIQILNPHSSRDGWLLGVAGRMARVPLIIRTRHIDVDYPRRRVSRHAFTTLADHVLTTSQKIKSHFQEIFHLPDSRISVVPTGIDTRLFSPMGPKAMMIPVNSSGAPSIGMVSVLRSWKGHSTFLDAARRLLDGGIAAHFIVVGGGPIRQSIERKIEELQLAGHVTLTGHREDVPEILRALDVLVIASTKHEGVPQIGLQALACKTPVAGSDVGGIPEIIRPGETGRIFHAGDAALLADAIREALFDAEQTRAFCERGRALVVASHSLDAMLDSIESIYRRYLSK